MENHIGRGDVWTRDGAAGIVEIETYKREKRSGTTPLLHLAPYPFRL